MNRIRNYTFIVLASCLLTALGSCKSATTKAATEEVQTDSVDSTSTAEKTLATDSIQFTKASKDSTITSHIVIDYPSGDNDLDIAVRKYIAQELSDLHLPGISDEPTTQKNPKFKGSLDNQEGGKQGDKEGNKQGDKEGTLEKGKELVDFFGNSNYQYLENELKEIKQYSGDAEIHMCYEANIRKTGETAHYLIYNSNTYAFLGGAHGSASDYSVNIDKTTGKVLKETVDTTQVKALQPILRKGVLRYFKAQGEKDVTEKNLSDYLFIEKGIIPLPKYAPYLAKDGVHFIYQQYEIGPYAMGMVSFVVPYSDIKAFLTAEALRLTEE